MRISRILFLCSILDGLHPYRTGGYIAIQKSFLIFWGPSIPEPWRETERVDKSSIRIDELPRPNTIGKLFGYNEYRIPTLIRYVTI